jgi:hypothetical protein
MAIFNGSAPQVKGTLWTCYGDRLQAQLNRWSLTNLALLGHDLETGAAVLTRTTPKQATAVIPRLTMALLRTVRQASPFELAAMRRGDFTVEALHREQLDNKRLSDAEVDRAVLEIGLELVLASCDRLTPPPLMTNGADGSAQPANDNAGAALPAQLGLWGRSAVLADNERGVGHLKETM